MFKRGFINVARCQTQYENCSYAITVIAYGYGYPLCPVLINFSINEVNCHFIDPLLNAFNQLKENSPMRSFLKPFVIVMLVTGLMNLGGMARSADVIVVSSYDPLIPTVHLNGFVDIQPKGNKVANQFTLYPGIDPLNNSIDQIKILYKSDTTDAELTNMKVSINYETGTPGEPGSVVQVTNPSPPPATVDLIFDQLGSPTALTLDGHSYLEVTYALGSGIYQVFPPPATSLPVNYWLVVENANTKKKDQVAWGSAYTNAPIYNDSLSASINPNVKETDKWGNWCQIDTSLCSGDPVMLFSLVHAPEPSTYILGTIVAAVLALTSRNPRFRKIHQNATTANLADY